MTKPNDCVRDARRVRHLTIRAEVAQEESEAAEADVESIARRVAREELHRT